MNALLERIAEIAGDDPSREAVTGSGLNLSYRDLHATIAQLSQELTGLGIRRLGLYANNCLEWLLVDLAALAADIAVVPIPLFFSESQVNHLVTNSQIQATYVGLGTRTTFGRSTSSKLLSGCYQWHSVEAASNQQLPFSKVTYTSGSTGEPKGACLAFDTQLTIVRSLATRLEPSQLGRHLCVLPFATLLENVAGIYLPLFMGRALIVDDTERLGLLSNHDFDPVRFADAVQRYDAESVILLPHMLKLLTESDEHARLRSLRFIAVGGGKVAPDMLRKAEELGIPVFEGYGLTECASCVALNTPGANRIGSVGKPLPHAQVRISERGEVMVQGAAMQGYLDDVISDSEIATGDSGYLDDEGFLHIVGRIKNTIVSSFGRNIAPEWVESQFLAESGIQQIAVFGEAKPSLSAVIVVEAELRDVDLIDVIHRVNASLPDYARITSWHRTHTPFTVTDGSLTNNGKLCRQVIAERFASELDLPTVAA